MSSNLIVAIITSGTVSAIISFYLTARQKEKQLRQEKLEELFICISQWIKSFGIFSLNYRGAMQGKLSLKEVYELMSKIAGSNEKDNLEKIEMIIGIYFPNLQSNYDELMSCRAYTNKVITKFESKAEISGIAEGEFVKELDAELQKLDKVELDFKAAIFREANTLLKPWWKVWH